MYILLCSDGSYYTGSTIDLVKRLEQHQNGDFLLAVASYNRGEYGIDMDEEQANNALNSAKNSNGFNQESLKDFTSDWWKILHFNMAPKQTQHYVIRVVTGIIFGMNPEKYGLTTKPISID
jgi:predicted GIY-YIG superfamily endonuclease